MGRLGNGGFNLRTRIRIHSVPYERKEVECEINKRANIQRGTGTGGKSWVKRPILIGSHEDVDKKLNPFRAHPEQVQSTMGTLGGKGVTGECFRRSCKKLNRKNN